jgi:hypothetical protein
MGYRRQLLQKCLEKKTTLGNKEWLASDVKIERKYRSLFNP